jgi:TRAP-type C4-dicarboxylate transport system permease small subunit
MDALAAIHARLEKISKWLVWVGGAALLVAAMIVTVDVLCRYLFGITMSGSDEISGYVFAASTTWAYSYCLLHRSNVRIDAIYNILPKRMTAVLDVVGCFLLLYYMWFMTKTAVLAAKESWDLGSVSITTLLTPQWIPQSLWALGLVMFFITLIFVSFYSFVALMQKNWDLVGRIAGVPSIAEVVEEETQGVDVMDAAAKVREA